MTWVKIENSPPTGPISILGHYNWRISTNNDQPRFSIVYDSTPPSSSDTVISNINLEVGKWQHYAAVYDYDAADGWILLYLDGNLVGSTNIGTHAIETNYNEGSQELIMGFSRHGGAINVIGEQDEVRIYNKALSQEEIQRNMYAELSGNEPNLVGYWDFNENGGGILNDIAGVYDCDLNGDPVWVSANNQ